MGCSTDLAGKMCLLVKWLDMQETNCFLTEFEAHSTGGNFMSSQKPIAEGWRDGSICKVPAMKTWITRTYLKKMGTGHMPVIPKQEAIGNTKVGIYSWTSLASQYCQVDELQVYQIPPSQKYMKVESNWEIHWTLASDLHTYAHMGACLPHVSVHTLTWRAPYATHLSNNRY